MDRFFINGPCKIKGSIKLSGSKNASLPILAATILFDEPVEIKNLPNVKWIKHNLKNEIETVFRPKPQIIIHCAVGQKASKTKEP